MSKNPQVSIIIPCYNMGVYVRDAIKSAYSQTYDNYEVIVVNDGSTDPFTIEQLKRLELTYPKLRILHKKNSGLAGARNYGIEKSKGELVVCLDADDMLDPHYLEKTVSMLGKDNKIAVATTWLQEFGKRKNVWETSDFNIPKLLVTNVIHAGSLFTKKAWEEAGGYKKVEKGGYEDWEFWLSIVEKGYEWRVVKEPLFRYRIRENSMLAEAASSHLDIYRINYDLHPDLYKKYSPELVLESAKEIAGLRAAINKKNASIDEYTKAVEYFKKEAANATEKLESLHQSRITQAALKLIDLSIFLRRTIPALKHKIKSVVRALVPKYAKQKLRQFTGALFPKKIVGVKNQKWQDGRPLVSIITPFYNSASSIRDTVNSVLSQTYQNIEYIIVNDGSEENQAKALDKIKDKKITIVHHKKNIGNGSPAAARNDGISKSSGKYVLCLDADDILDPTFVEKCLLVLETNPSVSLVTTDTLTFGSSVGVMQYVDYNPRELLGNNMVITASMFKKEAWEKVGGYKKGIGYEDWEFWINLAENGFFGKRISETLFKYRVSAESRYIEDKKKHRENLHSIQSLHSEYKKNVKKIQRANRKTLLRTDPKTSFINLGDSESYQSDGGAGKNILIAIPWMTFGGAETLILNFCREIVDDFNISFVTGLESAHEWEDKFKEITQDIYHLRHLFDDEDLYLEFISNYIKTRNIDVLHIIHTSFMFDMLPEIRSRHPELKIVVTLFNDRAHFDQAVSCENFIDGFATDNMAVSNHFKQILKPNKSVTVIPNGINCYHIFNPELFNKAEERAHLGIQNNDLAVFFIGRLSEEKNPDVFLEVAGNIVAKNKEENVKFFVIGDGFMKPEVEKMIEDIGSENVRYLGYQSDIAKYLSTADIFVLPSSTEGFPLSILEAMAMEVAVVASNVGAVSEVVKSGENGFVVPAGSVEEIQKAILTLNEDRQLLEIVKSRARQKIENKYSNTILGDNYKKMYEDILR